MYDIFGKNAINAIPSSVFTGYDLLLPSLLMKITKHEKPLIEYAHSTLSSGLCQCNKIMTDYDILIFFAS